jgi:WD40 repeat protein
MQNQVKGETSMNSQPTQGIAETWRDCYHLGVRMAAILSVTLMAMGFLTPTVMASPTISPLPQQGGGDATTIFVWLGLLVIVAGLILRFTYGSFAPSYTQEVASKLPVDQVWAQVDSVFPKQNIAGKPWTRKRPKEDPLSLVLSAYPLPYWSGCLIMLFTGIILGFIAWVLMGRLEKVTIKLVENDAGSRVKIEARGYAAVSMSRELVARLPKQVEAAPQITVPSEKAAPVATTVEPAPGQLPQTVSLSPNHYALVRGVTVSPDGMYVASCSEDKRCIVWDSKALSQVSEYRADSKCGAVAISPDSALVAVAVDGGHLEVFALKDGSRKFSSGGLSDLGFCVRFSPDNRFIAWTTWNDRAIGVLDVKTGQFLQRIDITGFGHPGMIDFSPDGNILGAMCSDGRLRLFEYQDSFGLKEETAGGRGGAKPSLCRFIETGKKMVCSTLDDVSVINLETKAVEKFSVSLDYFSLDLAMDGSILAAGDTTGTLAIYNFSSRGELFKERVHKGQVFSVACAPNGDFVVSSGADGTVKVWSAKPSVQPQVAPAEETTKLARLLKGIAEDPQWAHGHCQLGEEYIGLGDLEDAIKHFEQAVRLSPESEDVNTAYKYLAIIYQAQGDYVRAGQASAGDKRTDPHRSVGGTSLVPAVVEKVVALVQGSY